MEEWTQAGKQVWDRRNLHGSVRKVANVCAFSMVVLVIQKQFKGIFKSLSLYLSSFCTFCGFLPCTFAFCPLPVLEVNRGFQGNFSRYFIHTFNVNYSFLESCPVHSRASK